MDTTRARLHVTARVRTCGTTVAPAWRASTSASSRLPTTARLATSSSCLSCRFFWPTEGETRRVKKQTRSVERSVSGGSIPILLAAQHVRIPHVWCQIRSLKSCNYTTSNYFPHVAVAVGHAASRAKGVRSHTTVGEASSDGKQGGTTPVRLLHSVAVNRLHAPCTRTVGTK